MASTRELERTALIPAWDSLNQQWLWTVVDLEDYARVDFPKWRIKWSNLSKPHIERHPYVWTKNNGREVALHRLILDCPKGFQVDHIDGNTLDNRKMNMRLATLSQNQMNRKAIGGSSQYKGVCWNKRANKWGAYIKKDQKRSFLGYYRDEIGAALAYDKAARELFGAFAKPNFPEYNNG